MRILENIISYVITIAVAILLFTNTAYAADLSTHNLHPGKVRNLTHRFDQTGKEMEMVSSGNKVRAQLLFDLLNPIYKIEKQKNMDVNLIVPKLGHNVDNTYKNAPMIISEFLLAKIEAEIRSKLYYSGYKLPPKYGALVLSKELSNGKWKIKIVFGNKCYEVDEQTALNVEKLNIFYNYDITDLYKLVIMTKDVLGGINISKGRLYLESFTQVIAKLEKTNNKNITTYNLMIKSKIGDFQIIDKIIECIPDDEDLVEIYEPLSNLPKLAYVMEKDKLSGINTIRLRYLSPEELISINKKLFTKLRKKFILNLQSLQHNILEEKTDTRKRQYIFSFYDKIKKYVFKDLVTTYSMISKDV